MRAAYDVGIRQLVSDTTIAGQDNPSPNAGYYNAQVPGLLSIPRRATELYFNVSQPAEWIAEYGDPRGGDVQLRTDHRRTQATPWSATSCAARTIRGCSTRRTFATSAAARACSPTLIDAVLAKYEARATFPVVSPTMDELAREVKARMSLDASGVVATLEPGGKLTVRVTNAATVPVTGLCTPGAEAYAGQQISYLQLAAGQSITLSLTDCNGGSGAPAARAAAPARAAPERRGSSAPTAGSIPPRPTTVAAPSQVGGRGVAPGALLIAF